MIKQITLSELSNEPTQTKTKKKELLTVGRVVKDNRTALPQKESGEISRMTRN